MGIWGFRFAAAAAGVVVGAVAAAEEACGLWMDVGVHVQLGVWEGDGGWALFRKSVKRRGKAKRKSKGA